MHNKAAIDRVIALCRRSSRVLLEHCDIHLEQAEQGLLLAIDDRGSGVLNDLAQQEHLESLVGATLRLPMIQTIRLMYPDDPLEVAVQRFAALYNLDERAIDWANSVEQKATTQAFCRVDQRCKVGLQKNPWLTFILDQGGTHLECNNRSGYMVANWESLRGTTVEEKLPTPAAYAIMDALKQAFRWQEHPHYATYRLPVNGIPKTLQAKMTAYGDSEKAEAIAVVQDITLRRPRGQSRSL